MFRTKLSLSQILTRGLAACWTLVASSTTFAAPPHSPGATQPDYAASGFVVPAGYNALPSTYPPGVVQAGAPYGVPPMQPVQHIGFHQPHGMAYAGPACGCEPSLGCDGSCGMGGGGGCFSGRAGCDCEECSGLSDCRFFCPFCGADGCEVCQSLGGGHLLGMLAALAPYTEAGLGPQRWYDFSAEALFLALDTNAASIPVTSLGPGPAPLIVLESGQAFSDKLDAGIRLSGAMIFGAGGNLEVTYMGVNGLGGSAGVSNANPILYSFISEFGTDPLGGYDDTDRSFSQSILSESRFHTGEINYRRRWVGPYSRFQGSWLGGIRIVDLDDHLTYSTIGEVDNTGGFDELRFFNGKMKVGNSMTGFQLGGDLWWNLYPGISIGTELKGALLGNASKLHAKVTANSLPDFEGRARDSETAFMTEFSVTALYRFSYSWSFRSSYYLIDLEDVGLAGNALAGLVDDGVGGFSPSLEGFSAKGDAQLEGMSFGLEYIW